MLKTSSDGTSFAKLTDNTKAAYIGYNVVDAVTYYYNDLATCAAVVPSGTLVPAGTVLSVKNTETTEATNGLASTTATLAEVTAPSCAGITPVTAAVYSFAMPAAALAFSATQS